MARARRRLITVLVALVAVFALGRMFFFGRYYVNGPSMEPTIHGAEKGGDHLLVLYGDTNDLERFDLVAIQPLDGSEPVVKRAAGLPGEEVVLRDGDLWIDGALLPPDATRPAPVLVFDEEHADLKRWFRLGETWKQVEKGWELDAREVDVGAGAGLMFMRKGLKDHYLGTDGQVVEGRDDVGDGIVECEAAMGDPAATLRLGLVEQGDTFETVVQPLGGGQATIRLVRRSTAGPELLEEGEIPFGEGFHPLRFANVDNHLSVVVDGVRVLSHGYSSNTLFHGDEGRRGISPPTDRVFLGGEQGRALFRRIRVLRDLHYTPRGEYGIEEPIQLGPGDIFVLGDNSRESWDGRSWGATPRNRVFGRPVWVIWPPSRARSLSTSARQ